MPAPDLQWSERASHDAHADLANPMALISLFSLLPMIVGLGFDPYIKGYPLGWVAVSSAFNLAIGLSAACFLHWRLKRYKI